MWNPGSLAQGWAFGPRARQRAGRPGPEIFDPGFFDSEKNLFLNPEPGPDLKFSPETGPEKPGPLPSSVRATRSGLIFFSSNRDGLLNSPSKINNLY